MRDKECNVHVCRYTHTAFGETNPNPVVSDHGIGFAEIVQQDKHANT